MHSRLIGEIVEARIKSETVLASAWTEAPSQLMLDLQMPGLSGLDLQKRMTEAGVEPHRFPYGSWQYPSLVKATKARAIEFLTKPFSDTALLRLSRPLFRTS
ncbi:MAG TPA: response regulator [Bryobacteraceae bacterium]|nr:response regulator [Bryobacteraceae bacterium]